MRLVKWRMLTVLEQDEDFVDVLTIPLDLDYVGGEIELKFNLFSFKVPDGELSVVGSLCEVFFVYRLPGDCRNVHVRGVEQLHKLEVLKVINLDSKGRGKCKLICGARDNLLLPDIAPTHLNALQSS